MSYSCSSMFEIIVQKMYAFCTAPLHFVLFSVPLREVHLRSPKLESQSSMNDTTAVQYVCQDRSR